MQKSVKRRTSGRIVLATVAAVSLGIVQLGCDDQRSGDKEVLKDIQEARSARVKGNADEAEQLLQKAAQVNAGAATQAHAKSLLAQAEVENAIHLINDKENGVEAGNSEIARLLYEIGALGQQIQTSNALAAGYKLYNPNNKVGDAEPVKLLAQQHVAAAQGGPGKPTWFGEGEQALPSLSAVTEQVQNFQAQIAKLQAQIKTLQTQQTQVSQQADKATRAAAATQGQAGIQAEKVAADLRKKAADLANQIEVTQAKVPPLETDLAVAQARQAALTAATDQFQKLSASFDAGWKSVEDQVVKQQQLGTAVYQGVGGTTNKASTNSITTKAVELDGVIKKTQESYEKAEESLTNAITHFGEAATAAQKLQSELSSKSGDLRGTEMGKAIEALQQAFNPNTFKLGEADAQQLLATLYTSRISALSSRARLVNELRPILVAAGLSMPKQLDDPKLDATIKEIAKKAEESYAAVSEAYTNVAESSQNESQKTAGHIGRMFAAYGHTQLARAMSNAKGAEQFLAEARQARDLVIQDKGVAAIPAYPSELVPPAATQPSTAPAAPASAPAVAQAPTTPTPAAAPAEPGAVEHTEETVGLKYSTGPNWVEIPQPAPPGGGSGKAFQLKADHGPGKAKGALVIGAMPVDTKGAPPRRIADQSWKSIPGNENLERADDAPTKIGGKDAWSLTFSGANPEGMTMKGKMYVAAVPSGVIQIMFVTDSETYDAEAPLAQKVVDSITWTR